MCVTLLCKHIRTVKLFPLIISSWYQSCDLSSLRNSLLCFVVMTEYESHDIAGGTKEIDSSLSNASDVDIKRIAHK